MIENLPTPSEHESEENVNTTQETVVDTDKPSFSPEETPVQPEDAFETTVDQEEPAVEESPEELPVTEALAEESPSAQDEIVEGAHDFGDGEPKTSTDEVTPDGIAELSSVESVGSESMAPESEETPSFQNEPADEPSTGLSAASENHPEAEVLVLDEHELEEMEKQDEQIHIEDYSGLDKEQLVKLAEQLNREQDPGSASRIAQKIRPLFMALYEHDKNEALEKYLAGGGEAETFEFKHSGLETRFEQAVKGIFEKRKLNQDFQNKERAKNLEAKLTLLEQMRQLVDDHEHTPGYDKFKEIKEEWKKIGPVGPEHAQNLNASYYSLIERFYSLSEIYHNLRDFDRKKNLELKQELVSRIEKLASEPLISKAMKELVSCQEEYRSLGPVPKDKLDELRDRLKKAVDAIYERRRAFNEERKHQMAEEHQAKEVLVGKIAEFENFTASHGKDWQAKTKELLALQEEWKLIPGRFREKTGDLNKQFWGVFKKFMAAKNEFYKGLDKTKKDVLSQKQALVDEVNELKDGEDWDGIVNRMKSLQQAWKEIPPVFGKESQKVYDEFKAGMDHFFNRLRDRRSGEDKVQQDNLKVKEEICAEIESLATNGQGSRDQVEEFRDRFRNAGHVPMKSMQKINGRYSKALIDMVDKSEAIPAGDKERIKISILSSRSTYSSEGVKTLKNQEGYIQKRLQQLRKDVGTLEDNVAMFRMSKNAMALIEDVQKRINLSKLEIKELESQLKQIREGEKA